MEESLKLASESLILGKESSVKENNSGVNVEEENSVNNKRSSVRSKATHSRQESGCVFDEDKFNELENLSQVSSHYFSENPDKMNNDSAVFILGSHSHGEKKTESSVVYPKSQKSGVLNTRSSFFDINGDGNEEEEKEINNVSSVSSRVARENREDRREEAKIIIDKTLENLTVKNFLVIMKKNTPSKYKFSYIF